MHKIADTCSPRPRGWSLRVRRQVGHRLLLPAPAGMVPGPRDHSSDSRSAPRARGDGPSASGCVVSFTSLLPAPAGMVPGLLTGCAGWVAAPRARGDGPKVANVSALAIACSPRPRGWSRLRQGTGGPARQVRLTAPRARGDGPQTIRAGGILRDCSPRPRGWSRSRTGRRLSRCLLPAPAGMVPPGCSAGRPRPTAPRARGDGPPHPGRHVNVSNCSPRPRGWSPQGRPDRGAGLLLPAPAGMVPQIDSEGNITAAAPRARGDGP